MDLFAGLLGRTPMANMGRPANTDLLSVKAGKCKAVKASGRNYRVTPDKTPGFMKCRKDPSGILEFVWVEKTTGTEDRSTVCMVFPGDGIKLRKVRTGKPSDRVYMLFNPTRFESAIPVMFWLQDKDASTDVDNISKINNLFNGIAPPAAVQAGEVDFSSLISQYSANSASSSTPAPAANTQAVPPTPPPSSSSAGGHFTAADFRRIASQQVQASPLEEIVTAEGIIASGILQNPAVRAELIALLPEGQRSDDKLEENIRSPQFRQSLEALGHALQTDNYNSVLANFGLDPQAGAESLMAGDSVSAFLSSVQSKADQSKTESGDSNSMAVEGAEGQDNNSDQKPPSSGSSDKKDDKDDSSMDQ